jgi:hypothetical protein
MKTRPNNPEADPRIKGKPGKPFVVGIIETAGYMPRISAVR